MRTRALCCHWSGVGSRNERLHMPGSSTTPGRPGARVDVPVRVAFRLRNGVGAQDMNLYEAQWLAYALPYRRFAAALTDCDARLGADMDRYSFIVSDLHRLLVAGLPAHCETFCTSSYFGSQSEIELPSRRHFFPQMPPVILARQPTNL